MKDTAIYTRLSRDDGNDISKSIENQVKFLKDFALKNGFGIFKVYSDDGYSGLSFQRPAFNSLIADIEKGYIKNILTKDLSRLGRDYVMTGMYIEQYFPQHNIRYIAVADGIDTKESSSMEYTPFKAVINDMYARDISRKVRTSLNIMRQRGKYIGSQAPYGYKKDKFDKNKLIIDESVADNVRKIFSLYIDGYTYTDIANILNNEGIESPMKYKKGIGTGKWNSVTIKNILISDTYKGNITQNKRHKVNCKINKRVNIPQKDWIIVENTHEGIISKEIFDKASSLIKHRRGGL